MAVDICASMITIFLFYDAADEGVHAFSIMYNKLLDA
jgi:hypothetical protein